MISQVRNTNLIKKNFRNEDEEDAFSEPDKEESRRRMGIVCKDNNQNRFRLKCFPSFLFKL